MRRGGVGGSSNRVRSSGGSRLVLPEVRSSQVSCSQDEFIVRAKKLFFPGSC